MITLTHFGLIRVSCHYLQWAIQSENIEINMTVCICILSEVGHVVMVSIMYIMCAFRMMDGKEKNYLNNLQNSEICSARIGTVGV